MALQLWMPLTGDLKNQGLSNINLPNSTLTFVEGGKIGAKRPVGTSGWFSIPTMIGKKQMSFAYWGKLNATTSTNWLDSFSWYTTNGSSSYRSRQEFYNATENSMTTGVWYYNASNSGFTGQEVNKWYHYAFTIDYEKGESKFYINGELKKTTTNVDTSYYISGTNFLFQEKNLDYSINDFRLYDHCLSLLEVKKLSQGLILHYPLNRQGWGQENLVWDTHWDEISTKWSGWGSPPVREIVNTFGKKYLHVKSSDRWQGYSQNQAKRSGVGEITAGEKLTLSYWAYSNTTLTSYPCVGIHWTDGSSIIAQSWPLLTITTTPQKFTTVLTVPSGVSAFNIMVGNGSGTVSGVYEIWVADVKLERGEKSTPWCPNSSDELATTMGLNSTTEYDCSGFCNNGSKMTNTITYTSDTVKYAVSTHFNGTYDGIIIENLVLKDMINSTITYAFWIKPESESGARSIYFGSYSGISWSIEKTAGNQLRLYWNGSPDETCSGTTITDGVWQHICITKNGTNDVKVYINGVQKWTSTATHSSLNFPTTYRIGRDTRSNDGTPYKGLMSDFRVYATALSADDVKSLYQNCATIDPDGTIHGQIRS